MMMREDRYKIHAFALAAAMGVAFIGSRSSASTVVPMTFETLADHAGQVVMGTVESIRSYWADGPRRIESEITLGQVEYLKGALPDSSQSFTLIVPGGTVGRTHMHIGGAPILSVGEEWLLFVLPTYKTFPVVGLSQGALRIVRDPTGVKRVLNASFEPLAGVDKGGFATFASGSLTDAQAIAVNLVQAANVRVTMTRPQKPNIQGLAAEDLLVFLQPILANSTDHNLTEPAGRRVLAQYTPVPLELSSVSPPAKNGMALATPALRGVERGPSALDRHRSQSHRGGKRIGHRAGQRTTPGAAQRGAAGGEGSGK